MLIWILSEVLSSDKVMAARPCAELSTAGTSSLPTNFAEKKLSFKVASGVGVGVASGEASAALVADGVGDGVGVAVGKGVGVASGVGVLRLTGKGSGINLGDTDGVVVVGIA